MADRGVVEKQAGWLGKAVGTFADRCLRLTPGDGWARSIPKSGLKLPAENEELVG